MIKKNLYDQFEWYYFDLHSSNGYDVVCTIHPKPFNSVFKISIFDIFVYKNNQILFHHFFIKPDTFSKKTDDSFELRYDAANYLHRDGNDINLSIADGVIDLKLEFRSAIKTEPIVRQLIESNNSESLFNWIVYAPACNGKIDLNFEDQRLSLTGIGYHDFNSGHVNLKRELKYWYWGKFYFQNKLLIFGNIIRRDNTKKEVSLLINKDNLENIENPDVEIAGKKIFFNDYVFTMNPAQKIDDVSFYMGRFIKITILAKFLEFATHILKKIIPSKFLANMVGNTRYKRFRASGVDQNQNQVNCFYEEMIF